MMPRVLPMAAMLLAAAVVCGCDVPTRPGHTRDGGPVDVPPPPPPPPDTPSPPPGGGPFAIDGQYRLTMTASSSCSLPAEVKERSYTAKVTQSASGQVVVALSGAQFALEEAGFDGTRNEGTLRLVVYNGYGGPYFIERIDGTKNLFFEGTAYLAVYERSITGPFDGEIKYFVPGGQTLGTCTARDHRMTFTR